MYLDFAEVLEHAYMMVIIDLNQVFAVYCKFGDYLKYLNNNDENTCAPTHRFLQFFDCSTYFISNLSNTGLNTRCKIL